MSSLRDFVPDDHVLARVDRVLDLGWLRGRCKIAMPPMAPGGQALIPRRRCGLLLTGFLVGIVYDRRLMREAQVNIAICCFAGSGLADTLPDHSSLTRIRQQWGADRFRAMFVRTVKACMAARIACGEVVHIDATLIRAGVSWESLGIRQADAAIDQGDGDLASTAKKKAIQRRLAPGAMASRAGATIRSA